MLVETGQFIAKEVIDSVYTTDRLEELQKILADTKAKLAGIQDEEIIARMSTEAKSLELAQKAYQNAKLKFNDQMKAVRREEADVTAMLGKSKETKGAAGAIQERSEVAATAVQATENIKFIMSGVPKVAAAGQDLEKLYDRVRSELPNPNVSMAYNDEHREALNWLILENTHIVLQSRKWLEELTTVAQSSLEELSKGSYFEGYAKIPDVLDEAVAGK
jgi:hypothetical protein